MIEKQFLSKGQEQVPGIYGGMGPMAHIMFEQRLLEASKERGNNKDQDHPVWILVNASSTPDRTASLINKDTKARDHLTRYANFLQGAGANFLVMTCNTAHAYLPEMREAVAVPIISMIDETAEHIKATAPDTKNVGIMATSGTIVSGLYHNALADRGFEAVAPTVDSTTQKKVMDAIYNDSWGIKATGAHVSSRAKDSLLEAMDWYKEQGSEAVILGCTELSVALDSSDTEITLFDPLVILAKKTIDLAYTPKLD